MIEIAVEVRIAVALVDGEEVESVWIFCVIDNTYQVAPVK